MMNVARMHHPHLQEVVAVVDTMNKEEDHHLDMVSGTAMNKILIRILTAEVATIEGMIVVTGMGTTDTVETIIQEIEEDIMTETQE